MTRAQQISEIVLYLDCTTPSEPVQAAQLVLEQFALQAPRQVAPLRRVLELLDQVRAPDEHVQAAQFLLREMVGS